MRKVLFLDIDGVLNTALFHNNEEREQYRDKYGYVFDPNAVANLKMIIDETGAEIVISSSWKYMGVEKLRKMWEDRCLPGKIIDITPDSVSDEFLLNAELDDMSYGLFRGLEIKEWLMHNGKDVSHYAIIDDMYDMLPEQQSHFIFTDPNAGITEWDAVKAIAILNKESDKNTVTEIKELTKKKLTK